MRYKRTFAVLAILMAVCTAAYAVNIQGLLMNTGIEWSGNALRVFNPIDLDNGWKIDGTSVTATAAELNASAGTGLSAAELGVLNGVTPGTSATSKAVVLGGTGKIDTIDMTAWKIGGVAVTPTAAELNVLAAAGIDATEIGFLNGVAAGTSGANKAVVLGGTGKINAIDVTALTLNGTALTATAAAINAFIGSGLTGAEVGYLDDAVQGVLTASKCMVADASKQIDEVDVKTTFQLNNTTVTSTAAELNYVDITTAGSIEASKAVILDASKQIDEWDILTTFQLANTTVTSSAAELNYNDITTLGTSQASKTVTADASNQVLGLDCKTDFAIENVNVTSTAAELNYCDVTTLGAAQAGKAVTTTTPGNVVTALDITTLTLNGTAVTSTPAEINALAGAGLSGAELGVLNGVTGGTKTASKAIVVDGAGKIDTMDITSLVVNGAALTATAAELNAVTGNVTAVQAQANALKMVRTFTETAGAGTYTATVAVPAGYTLLNISVTSSAVWNNTTSATLNVGDDDDPDGYFATVDLKTVPAAAGTISTLPNVTAGDYGVYCGAPKAYAGVKTITATVVTVHAVGDTGRSTLIVEMVKTANAVAAASKA